MDHWRDMQKPERPCTDASLVDALALCILVLTALGVLACLGTEVVQ